MNSFEGNEAWNNLKGINLVNQQFATGMYPSIPGGDLDTTPDGFKMKPLVFKGQVVAANSQVGLEMWATLRFLDEDLIAATELIEGGPNVNQELGQVLNKTPKQVSKLKERLLMKEGVKELYAARQAAKSRA